jgi:hypothetical protein
MNHNARLIGIPLDSIKTERALALAVPSVGEAAFASPTACRKRGHDIARNAFVKKPIRRPRKATARRFRFGCRLGVLRF